jgi:hypothetical protein
MDAARTGNGVDLGARAKSLDMGPSLSSSQRGEHTAPRALLPLLVGLRSLAPS